jgi:hypothetical protein
MGQAPRPEAAVAILFGWNIGKNPEFWKNEKM